MNQNPNIGTSQMPQVQQHYKLHKHMYITTITLEDAIYVPASLTNNEDQSEEVVVSRV